MVRSQQRIDEQEARDADATKAIDEEIEKLTQKANEAVRALAVSRSLCITPSLTRGAGQGEEGRVEEWKAMQAQVSELKQKRAAVAANSALAPQDDGAPPLAPPPVPVPAGVVRCSPPSASTPCPH